VTVAPIAVAVTVALASWATLERAAARALVAGRLAEVGGRHPRRATRGVAAPLDALGAAVLRGLHGVAAARARRLGLPPPPPVPVAPGTARRVGAAVVALGLAVVSPWAAAAAVLAVVAPELARRRRAARSAPGDESVATLPDAVDLLAVAARAGLPALAAVAAVAERAPPPWDGALAAVAARTRRGERFVDALDELPARCGEPAQALRAVLRAAVDDGDDLPAGLDRLAADARDRRRRRAEESARRVPIRLLAPLVACSLPAFALLSIVPILVGALRTLDL
jgi:Flp pilus assembly protein TadB